MRVLVIEDAPALAAVIAEGLRDQGMAVDIALNGLTAAEKLNLAPYEVVVLDRDLPGLHGDTLCQMISERDGRPMILMLTAAGAPGDRVTGLTLGADDYLAKPFHFPELVLRVRAWPAAAHRRSRGHCAPPDWNSTRPGTPPPATAASWTCPPRSLPCWRRSCGPRRRS